jgi:hypothetical protein
MLVQFLIIFVMLIILWLLLLDLKKKNINQIFEEANYTNYNQINDLNKCTVPTLNTEQCYKSRYYECPIVNGTYLQCTNNYIPKPKEYNADCGNRTFDMVPYPWKISENCYYNSIGFDREKEFGFSL